MVKRWSDEAWEDFLFWQKNDKKVFKKILELIKDIDRNGYAGIGKPEGLKHELSGYCGAGELMKEIELFIK